jgi:hypothetical protein
MKKKKIKIIIVLFICIAFLLGCRMIQLSLKQPVYYRYLVEHYLPTVADSLYETSIINLIYITNIWDEIQVTNVTFDEHPELTATVYGTNSTQYGIYKVVNVLLYLEWDQSATDTLPDVAKIHNIQVTYSNQRSQTIVIGKLYIHSGESAENLLKAVDCLPLYSSERLQTYEALEEILINGFSPATLEWIEDADIIEELSFSYENNDLIQPSNPITVNNRNLIKFIMKLKGLDKKRLASLESKYDYYEFEPQIELYDRFEDKYFVTVFNPYITLEFDNYFDVRDYLKRRR